MIDWLTLTWPVENHACLQFLSRFEPSVVKFGNTLTIAQYSGEYWHKQGDPDAHAIDMLGRTVGRVSRADFAFDFEQEVDYFRIFDGLKARYYADGKPMSGKPQVTIWHSNGSTVYVGKRSSSRFLRIYDKRQEMIARHNVDVGYEWCRVELEVKRDAVSDYVNCLKMGGPTARSAIAMDIEARYILSEFGIDLPTDGSENLEMIRQTNRHKQSDALRFVRRYHAIIRRAFDENCEEASKAVFGRVIAL